MPSEIKITDTPAAFVGIDWADQEHAVCLKEAGSGRCEASVLKHTPETIDERAAGLRKRFGGRPVAVCLEHTKGALIYALLKYDFFLLYPINPAQLAHYRKAMSQGGAKDDPSHAELLLEYLCHYRHRMHAWKPDHETTRLIRILVEKRRQAIDSAETMQSCSGIAPVTKRSGKSCVVHRRRACPQFLRQTFHEFAHHSIAFSDWAKAYYQQQRQRGNKHHAAVRALAVTVHRGLSLFSRRGECDLSNGRFRRENGTVPLGPQRGQVHVFGRALTRSNSVLSPKNGPVPD